MKKNIFIIIAMPFLVLSSGWYDLYHSGARQYLRGGSLITESSIVFGGVENWNTLYFYRVSLGGDPTDIHRRYVGDNVKISSLEASDSLVFFIGWLEAENIPYIACFSVLGGFLWERSYADFPNRYLSAILIEEDRLVLANVGRYEGIGILVSSLSGEPIDVRELGSTGSIRQISKIDDEYYLSGNVMSIATIWKTDNHFNEIWVRSLESDLRSIERFEIVEERIVAIGVQGREIFPEQKFYIAILNLEAEILFVERYEEWQALWADIRVSHDKTKFYVLGHFVSGDSIFVITKDVQGAMESTSLFSLLPGRKLWAKKLILDPSGEEDSLYVVFSTHDRLSGLLKTDKNLIGTERNFYAYGGENVFESIPAKEARIKAYPNPFNSAISIEGELGAEVKIYDLSGKLIFSGNAPCRWSPEESIPSGIYIVKIITINKEVVIQKIILAR